MAGPEGSIQRITRGIQEITTICMRLLVIYRGLQENTGIPCRVT